MMNRKISIIVPVHNNATTIKKCLNSILNQDYRNIEVIVVINATNDNTEDIVKSFDDKRIKVLKTDVPGVSNARNIGLKSAQGDVIGFCDADDFFYPGVIKKIMKLFENEYDIIVCGYQECFIDQNNVTVRIVKKCLSESMVWDNSEFFKRIILDNNIMGSVWNKFYKSKLLDNIQFDNNIRLCEDTDFNTRVEKENNDIKVYYFNEIGYNYVHSENYISATSDWKSMFVNGSTGYIEALEKIKNSVSKNKRKYCNAAIVRLSIEGLKFGKSVLSNDDYQLVKKSLYRKIKNGLFCFICSPYISLKSKIKYILIWIFKT